jgi:hypothetical protein
MLFRVAVRFYILQSVSTLCMSDVRSNPEKANDSIVPHLQNSGELLTIVMLHLDTVV